MYVLSVPNWAVWTAILLQFVQIVVNISIWVVEYVFKFVEMAFYIFCPVMMAIL